jgi:hypothetical protein
VLQQTIVIAIVLTAFLFLGRRVWGVVASARAKKGDAACASGCGCEPAAPRDEY